MEAYGEKVFLGYSASRDDVIQRFGRYKGCLQSLARLLGPLLTAACLQQRISPVWCCPLQFWSSSALKVQVK